LVDETEALKKRIQELQSENMLRLKGQPNAIDENVVFQLREENLILEETISDIQQKLNEYSTRNQSLTLELNTKSKTLNEHVTELEEIEMRCTTYFNHLQVCVKSQWAKLPKKTV